MSTHVEFSRQLQVMTLAQVKGASGRDPEKAYLRQAEFAQVTFRLSPLPIEVAKGAAY